jgi:diadenosine tetraphosphate (Ap4A) HIT family hydrolase
VAHDGSPTGGLLSDEPQRRREREGRGLRPRPLDLARVRPCAVTSRRSSPSERPEADWIASTELAFAIRGSCPVGPGHALVVPCRLIATWFEASREERQAIFDLVDEVKRLLDARTPAPDGSNIDINCGEAIGQTVMHLQVHVIPRYRGDVRTRRAASAT